MDAVDGCGDAGAVSGTVLAGVGLDDVTGGSSETSDAASSNRSSSECPETTALLSVAADFAPRDVGADGSPG